MKGSMTEESNVIPFPTPQQLGYRGETDEFPGPATPPEVDPLLDGETVNHDDDAPQKLPLAERADVIGLTMQSVWDIAEQAKVSRGKARRVLSAFEQYFLMRLDEAYSIGARDGALSIINKIEQAQQENSQGEVIEMEASDELTDDPKDAASSEGSVSPEA